MPEEKARIASLEEDYPADRRRLLESARELQDRFNEASSRWPTLRHVLVVFSGDLPIEVQGRRCMLQGDGDGGPAFDASGEDLASCLRAVGQKWPSNLSMSVLPVRHWQGNRETPVQPTKWAMCVEDDSRAQASSEAVAYLNELAAAAWHFLVVLPDESWSLLSLPPEQQHDSNGVAKSAWIGDYRMTEVEARKRRWTDESGEAIETPSAAERTRMNLRFPQPGDGWLFAVHNLAWRRLPGTLYRGHRRTWSAAKGNSLLTFEHDFGAARKHVERLLVADHLDWEFPVPLKWFRSDLDGNPFRASALALRQLVDPCHPQPPTPRTRVQSAAETGPSSPDLRRRFDRLKKMERKILQTLNERKVYNLEHTNLPTQEALAKWTGYPYDASLKAALSSLVKACFLDNGRHHGLRGGYFLTPDGKAAAEMCH